MAKGSETAQEEANEAAAVSLAMGTKGTLKSRVRRMMEMAAKKKGKKMGGKKC